MISSMSIISTSKTQYTHLLGIAYLCYGMGIDITARTYIQTHFFSMAMAVIILMQR